MRFGVQMFGLNPLFLADSEGFLKKITAAGYRYLEPCLTVEPIPTLHDRVWTLQELTDRLPLLEQYGVKLSSAHVFTRDILTDAPALIQAAHGAGIPQLVLPCPAFTSEEQYATLVPGLKEAAALMAAQGVELLLHNSGNESAARIGSLCAYEWLLRETGIGAQPDVGWLAWGGVDPESFLWRNRDQVKSLHYKDMKDTESGMTETGIGTGCVDMTACFQFARYVEILQIADQDGSDCDFLEDMARVGGLFRQLENCRDQTASILCVMDTQTGEITQLHRFDGIIEAPNWYQQDPDILFYNADGRIVRYRISTGESTVLESGSCINCNNDHVLSYDGTEIAVSHSSSGWASQVYIFPISGGSPRLITPNWPSFLHGWSPDGQELAYCAFRDHGQGTQVDIYTISRDGGEERRLTADAGFNDGPEYSPDGSKILFISTRSGLMQNWVMNRDGSDPIQLTHTDRNNWFGHYSPDGSKIVYLSYSRDGLDPNQHLPNMQVRLNLMNADGTDDHTILNFFGGQGSINVNSWHPDSRHFAFVRYELTHK